MNTTPINMLKLITRTLLLLAFLANFTPSFAKQIPIAEAESLVKTVIQRNASATLKNARDFRVTERFTKSENGLENFYIFNLAPTGFVIIAADDRYNAVLAFSDESNIDLSKKQEYIGLWGTLSYHESRMNYIRENRLTPTLAVQNEWKTLRSGNTATSRENGIVVAPLTTTKWNQGTYYNAECPANEETVDAGPDGRTYCGCAPIAMAQLIKFHNSPVNGNGSNSYIDPIYGEQSADFCSTVYNWDNMPDELTGPNADVAKLAYHMGVSTFTSYSTSYTSTYISYIRDAFVNYFGFDQSANWFYDANGDFNWVARNDLNKGYPLILSGESIHGGAHTWVADGYGYFDASGGEGTSEYFHFNWGWGGDNNGWFLDTDESWFPRGDEPNNVEISYYFDRYVIQKLFPAANPCQAPDDYFANGVESASAYLNVYYASGDQDISFRYKKVGSTDWIETPATSNFYQLIGGLEQAKEYEYQARRKCCPSDWSDWSASKTFASAGFVPCTPLAASGITTSSITDLNAYIYTVQPNGAVVNQFRYRPTGTENWLTTDQTTNYYRYLSDLLAGTTYEVQVRQLCSNGDFSGYSGSFTFTTTGNQVDKEGENPPSDNNCQSVAGNNLTTSSVTDNNAYLYTPQPLGAINNQFRYRPVGTTDWLETDVSTVYYRYLSNLLSGTQYEFQAKHSCDGSTFSTYSTSAYFTTTGTAENGNTDGGDNGGETTNGDCVSVDVSGLFTSSVGNANAYVYTPQPLGTINNQFRYRPMGTAEWMMTDISMVYYRYLSNLLAGTNYEFQARQECTANNWSEYSASEFFTTTGNTINNKYINQVTIPIALTLEELAQANPIVYGKANINTVTSNVIDTRLMVYPNPTTNILYLESNKEIATQDNIRVMDRVGRLMGNIQLSVDNKQARMDVSSLESGVYLIQLITDKEVKTVKFVKR